MEAKPPSLWRALWITVVTVSTVGYGDFVPVTGIGRFVASVIMIFGLALVPAVTAIVISTMMARRDAERSAPVGRDQPSDET